MKKAKLLLMTLAVGLGAAVATAEEVPNYVCDFNTKIDTSNHAFKVASNWGHIVDSYEAEDDYGWGTEEYFVSYSWKSANGASSDGYLYGGNQYVGTSYDSGNVYDLIVTPEVKGTVSMKLANTDGSSSYCEIYSINEDGTKGSVIKKFTASDVPYSYSNSWVSVTLPEELASYAKLGIRLSRMGIDDFSASYAKIEPDPGLTFVSVRPEATTGTLYWNEQPNHKVKVTYNVIVKNNGTMDLTQGMENYSITVWNGTTKADVFTVPVPQDLAVGETSEEFEVSAEIEPQTVWAQSYSSVKLNLRENCSNNTVERATSQYKSYEPVFVMREAGKTSTSSYSTPVAFGIINEQAKKEFEIYNDGAAPLNIISMTLPEGFTGLPEETAFTLQSKESKSFSVTLPTTTPGVFTGDLTIVYKDKNDNDKTYTLAVSGTVAAEGTWRWDFGTQANQYPVGSIAGSGTTTDYSYNSGIYNYYLRGASYNSDFILPLLHAEAGGVFSFDVKGYGIDYPVEVYVSRVRDEWPDEAILKVSKSEINSSTFTTKSFTIEEAGDYYILFKLPSGNTYIDNLYGFTEVEVANDIYFRDIQSPDEKKSGEEISFNARALTPRGVSAADYSVEFIGNGDVLATATSADYPADAKADRTFAFEFTPEVEETTVFDTFVRFRFTDGSIFESAHKEMKIMMQPDFVFFDKGSSASASFKPSNRTKPILFGDTNEMNVPKEFEIYNWGSAPLTVSSITVPEGFSVTPESCIVAGGERQVVAIAISTETPGHYEGNLTINYTEIDGDKVFELPVSANLLDPSKWYALFTSDDSTSVIWPSGTIHGKNISASNTGTYSDPIWGINSMSTTDNMFISPLLHAEAGDILEVNAKLYSSSYSHSNGYAKFYVSATREGLEDETARTLVATISGKEDEASEGLKATDKWNIYNVKFPEAGDYYVGVELGNRLFINSFYGLSKAAVEHDLKLSGSHVPASMMQNVVSSVSVSLQNFGTAVETADAYTVQAYVNGELTAESTENPEIPVSTSYNDDATTVSIAVRYPQTGVFPVQIKVTAGSLILETEPVDVTFVEEVFSNEKQIGELFQSSGDKAQKAPLNLYGKNSESVMLYSADMLGLTSGDKISSFSFKGFNEAAKTLTSNIRVHYAWVDTKSIEKPASGIYQLDDMTEGLTETRVWTEMGSKNEPVDILKVEFAEPAVYEAGKSLLIVASSEDGSNWLTSGTYGFNITNIEGYCYEHNNDTKSTYVSSNWNAANLPVLYLALAGEPVMVTGCVTDGVNPIEGAEVKAVSTDGDNVTYAAITDAEGNYSLKVIQNSRIYNVTATYGELSSVESDASFAENTTLDFVLAPDAEVITIDNTGNGGHETSESATVQVKLELVKGFNPVVLPFDVTADEVADLFGADAKVLNFSSSSLDEASGNLNLVFDYVADADNDAAGMTAGMPYLVMISADATTELTLERKKVIAETFESADSNCKVLGTYESKPISTDMYLLGNDNHLTLETPSVRSAAFANPYSSYVQVLNQAVSSVTFSIAGEIPASINSIDADEIGENDEVFTLQGLRVIRPYNGIFIVNGKKVLVK